MRILASLIALLLLTSCAGGNGPLNLGYIFPPGASAEVVGAQLVVTGTGGTLTAQSIRIIGTNGFPITANTNILTPAIPAGTLMQVK